MGTNLALSTISILILSATYLSCTLTRHDKSVSEIQEVSTQNDLAMAAVQFCERVLGESLRIHPYERRISGYLDVQMLFETEQLFGYTAFSNEQYEKDTDTNNYEGCILFVAHYENVESAEFAFDHLKSNSQIRLSDIKGMAGLVVEQVQVLERIRKSGGLFAQKSHYVFYLTEGCKEPLLGESWNEYEDLFLASITDKNEKIDVINADCEMDRLLVQTRTSGN